MKIINILLMVLVTIFATNINAQSALNEEERDALTLVKKFNQLFWNFENVDAGVALLSSDFAVQDPSNQFVLSPMKPTEAAEKRTYLNRMMPNLTYRIENVVVSGNTVILFNEAEFTHTKVIKTKVGIAAPTGKKVKYKVVLKFEIENGKIQKMWLLYDMFSRDLQLGLYPELLK